MVKLKTTCNKVFICPSYKADLYIQKKKLPAFLMINLLTIL